MYFHSATEITSTMVNGNLISFIDTEPDFLLVHPPKRLHEEQAGNMNKVLRVLLSQFCHSHPHERPLCLDSLHVVKVTL